MNTLPSRRSLKSESSARMYGIGGTQAAARAGMALPLPYAEINGDDGRKHGLTYLGDHSTTKSWGKEKSVEKIHGLAIASREREFREGDQHVVRPDCQPEHRRHRAAQSPKCGDND